MKLQVFCVLVALFIAQFACIPPQDCQRVDTSISGTVVNAGGNPIANANVHIYNEGSFELPPFDVQVMTNEEGKFTTETISSFACTPFYVEISLTGYITQKHIFYPRTGEGVNEYPIDAVFTYYRTN